MKPSIAAKLSQLVDRQDEVSRLLASEEATRNMDQFRKLTREHAEITPVVELFQQYQQCQRDLETAQEMLADPDMRELAEAELKDGKERLLQLDAQLQALMQQHRATVRGVSREAEFLRWLMDREWNRLAPGSGYREPL